MRQSWLLGGVLMAGIAVAQLRITEICPRPGVADPNGKASGWVELTNTSETETVDLSDYALIRFNRGNKDSSKKRLALLPQKVAPGARFVVYASEAYENFADIGGSGKVAWLGEREQVMVYPVKINPKKYPTLRLYKESELVDSFDVPVDLADGKSFAPGASVVTQTLLDAQTPYTYRADGEETWQTGGQGRLGVAAAREVAAVPGALAVQLSPDSAAFVEEQLVQDGVARQVWNLSGNAEKNQGLTAPAETLASAEEAYTVAFWFKAESLSGTDDEAHARVLFDYRPSSGSDQSGIIAVLTSTGQIRVQLRDAGRTASLEHFTDADAHYGDGAWHHLVLVVGRKAGSVLKVWADGVREVASTLPFDVGARSDVRPCFGRAYNSSAWAPFDGALSDIRFYPRALDNAEAAALFGEVAEAREVTGALTKADALTEADGLYTFPEGLANATSAQLYSAADVQTLASGGETVDLWLKPATLALSTGKPIALVDARSGGNTADGFVLAAEGSGALKIERKGTQQEWIDLGLTLEAGVWVHLTLAYDAQSGVCTCYRNGELVGTFSAVNSYTPPAGNHYFGSSGDGYWSAFVGQLAAPRIFSGVLSASEVARLHNASPLAEEVGKVMVAGLVEGVQTLLSLPTAAPVEAQVSLTVREQMAQGQLHVAAEVVGGELTVTLDGQTIDVGAAAPALEAGEHTLAWRLAPAEEAAYATAEVAAWLEKPNRATTRVILPTPTPGEANDLTGAVPYGPNIGPEVGSGNKGTGVTAEALATPGTAYTVTYELHPLTGEAGNAISAVTLLYCADFGEVKRAAMTEIAPNLWQGRVPAEDVPAEGHLLRYAAEIVDGVGGTWRSPSFCNPDDGYAWYGALVLAEKPDAEAMLQRFHLFADSTALANMDKQYDSVAGELPLGARVGVFDEQTCTYYDNVRIDLRGNTTASFTKKSHGLRFSKCQPLVCRNPFDGEQIEVRKTSFIAEYCDPTYIRQALSFWLMRQAGNLVPFDYPVQLNLNGAFYQLAFHSNRFTDELIEDYYGLAEADGSVGYGYKNVGTFSNVGGSVTTEKKTPDDDNEGDLSVLDAFTATLPQDTVTSAEDQAKATRRVVEAFDLSAWVNYLAAARITQECDDIWGNLSAYYDNLHTDTWMPLAYDLNLSFGQWYFNDDASAGRIGLRADDDTFKSHPLYGGFKIRAYQKNSPTTTVGRGNSALEALFQNPKFRRLYLRRLRTLMDAYLKAPGTEQATTPLWQQACAYREVFEPIVAQDRAKWNYSTAAIGTAIWVWNGTRTLEEGFDDLWENYFLPRRVHLYQTHTVRNEGAADAYGSALSAEIPAAQSALAALAPNLSFANARSTDGSEAGFSGDCLIIHNGNDEALDLSGWTLSGAVEWSLPAGTVVDAQDDLYVVADRKAYVAGLDDAAKEAAPVILGNATFSTTAIDLTLAAADGTAVCSISWAPPTDEKRYLRVVEVYANTADAQGDGAEYIVLKNLSAETPLALEGVELTAGKRGKAATLHLTLAASTLAPGATCRLEKAAFSAEDWPKLTNGAVDMCLYDRVGALIQQIGFTSSGAADGYGASLIAQSTGEVLTDEDWLPSFALPTLADGSLNAEAAAAIQTAVASRAEVATYLASLDAEGQTALAAFSGSAQALEICYLLNIAPASEPDAKLAITSIAFDEAGRLILESALQLGGEAREATVNGQLILESFETLEGAATETPLDARDFPLELSVLPAGAKFFRISIR